MIACPQCGKLNPENFNYCLDCGAELHPETPHSAESQFFIDLSAQSPDVEQAHQDAGKTPLPTPDPASRPDAEPTPHFEQPADLGRTPVPSPKPTATNPGNAVLELSPDDLLDNLDDTTLDSPLDNRALDSGFDSGFDSGLAESGFDSTDGRLETSLDSFDPSELTLDMEQLKSTTQEPEPNRDAIELPAEPVISDQSDDIDFNDRVELEQPTEQSQLNMPSESKPIVLGDQASADLLTPVEPDSVDNTPAMEVDMGQQEQFNCWKCGATLKPTDHFCAQCGTAQDQKPAEGGQTMFMHVGTSDSISTQPVAKLTIVEPSGKEGRVFNLDAGANICGRTAGGILLDDTYVSPEHCDFGFEDGKIVLKDSNSLNGVFIKLKGETEISSRTFFRIGQQLLLFVILEDFQVVSDLTPKDDTFFLGSPTGSTWGKLLRISNDGRILEHLPLANETIAIGRENGDITFPADGFVSSAHATLKYQDDKVLLTDLGSSNGTFLRVDNYPLNDRDMVLVGKKLLRLEYV